MVHFSRYHRTYSRVASLRLTQLSSVNCTFLGDARILPGPASSRGKNVPKYSAPDHLFFLPVLQRTFSFFWQSLVYCSHSFITVHSIPVLEPVSNLGGPITFMVLCHKPLRYFYAKPHCHSSTPTPATQTSWRTTIHQPRKQI